MLIQKNYHETREQINDGDIIAFGGKGQLSNLIKLFTFSNVSHVAIVMKGEYLTSEGIAVRTNNIIESTTIGDTSGVFIGKLSNRLKDYSGEAWWLPLSEEFRAKLDVKIFYKWLKEQNRKPYDIHQAMGSAFDLLWHNKEDFDRMFCSELAAGALKIAGGIQNINASEVTPIDLCMFKIYSGKYYQLSGDEKPIRGYNRIDPEGFGL